jgi:hypothetical protein
MGLLCLPPKVWYNRVMETISGGPSKDEVNRYFDANQILESAKLNKALENWVVTEVPDDTDGEIGDVVFVTGPGDGGSPGGGGKVLQVVRETNTSSANTNNTDWEDEGISLTITPQKSDSTILLQHIGIYQATAAGQYIGTRITDSSDTAISGAQNVQFGAAQDAGMTVPCAMFAYTVPATTNPVTYKMQFKAYLGTSAVSIRNDINPGQFYAFEVSA